MALFKNQASETQAMAYYSTILSQAVSIISRDHFKSIVDKHKGDHRVRSFSCWAQLMVMLYAQLTDKESLRDLETAIMSKKNFSPAWVLRRHGAQRYQMPTPRAIGKSIAICFRTW